MGGEGQILLVEELINLFILQLISNLGMRTLDFSGRPSVASSKHTVTQTSLTRSWPSPLPRHACGKASAAAHNYYYTTTVTAVESGHLPKKKMLKQEETRSRPTNNGEELEKVNHVRMTDDR